MIRVIIFHNYSFFESLINIVENRKMYGVDYQGNKVDLYWLYFISAMGQGPNESNKILLKTRGYGRDGRPGRGHVKSRRAS